MVDPKTAVATQAAERIMRLADNIPLPLHTLLQMVLEPGVGLQILDLVELHGLRGMRIEEAYHRCSKDPRAFLAQLKDTSCFVVLKCDDEVVAHLQSAFPSQDVAVRKLGRTTSVGWFWNQERGRHERLTLEELARQVGDTRMAIVQKIMSLPLAPRVFCLE